MEGDQALESDVPIEFAERALVTFFAAQIVAGGEGVLGIEAEPQPIAFFDGVEDPPHLFEAITQVAALAGGYLQREASL